MGTPWAQILSLTTYSFWLIFSNYHLFRASEAHLQNAGAYFIIMMIE